MSSAVSQPGRQRKLVEPTANERKLSEALAAFKAEADVRISPNAQILNNEAFAKVEMTTYPRKAFPTFPR